MQWRLLAVVIFPGMFQVAARGSPLLSHRTASPSRMRVACGRVDLGDGDARPFLEAPQARPG
jgi:hypothetical protein